MAFEEIYKSEQYQELAEMKKKSDALKQDCIQSEKHMHQIGEPFYRQIENYLIQEKNSSKVDIKYDDKEGWELAKKLCEHNVHPWKIRQSYVGSAYAYYDHKKVPKYFISYCPICGKILSTKQRIYKWRFFKGYVRKVIDISREDFIIHAGECGFRMDMLERYYEELPRFNRLEGFEDMYQKLQTLVISATPEVEKIILDLLAYFDKEQLAKNTKSKRAKEAERNAEELCRIFGHDTFGPEEPCRCCGQYFTKEQLLKDYEHATLSGVVQFPYVSDYWLLRM